MLDCTRIEIYIRIRQVTDAIAFASTMARIRGQNNELLFSTVRHASAQTHPAAAALLLAPENRKVNQDSDKVRGDLFSRFEPIETEFHVAMHV